MSKNLRPHASNKLFVDNPELSGSDVEALIASADLCQQCGRIKESERLYRKALSLSPLNTRLVLGLTSLLNSTEKFNDSLLLLDRQLGASSQNIHIYNQRGLTLVGLNRLDEAHNSFQDALHLCDTDITTRLNISFCFLKGGKCEQAIKTAAEILVSHPDNIEAIKLLGECYAELGGFDQAALCYTRIDELQTQFCEKTQLRLATYLRKAGNTSQAIEVYKLIVLHNPVCLEAAFNLANIYAEDGEFDHALAQLQALIGINPESAPAHNNIAMVYVRINNIKKAFQHFELALVHHPGFCLAYVNRAHLHREIGDIASAIQDYKSAISADPDFLPPYFYLSSCINANKQPEYLKHCLNIYESHAGSPDHYLLDFAIGKYYRDLGSVDAFRYLQSANSRKFETFKWRRPDYARLVNSVTSLVKAAAALSLNSINVTPTKARSDDSETKYIFIVGLPRSGSTLVETILSKNSCISSLGEINCLHDSIQQYSASLKRGVVEDLEDLYRQQILKLSRNYNSVACFTDKMLTNYVYAELIHRFFPSAKVVHVHRNIMDNVWSIFSNNFAKGNEWSFDLDEISEFIVAYRRSISDIKQKYPSLLYECNYDLLVTEPSAYIRELVDYCGLEWDDSYLTPEKSNREVNTASAVQVRSAIHSKSVGSWCIYSDQLECISRKLRDLGFEF